MHCNSFPGYCAHPSSRMSREALQVTRCDGRIEAYKIASRLSAATYVEQKRRWPGKAERRGRRRPRFACRGDALREVFGLAEPLGYWKDRAGLEISVTGAPSEFEWANTHEEEGKACKDSLGFSQLHPKLLEQVSVSHEGARAPGERRAEGEGRPSCLHDHHEPFRKGYGLPKLQVEARRCRSTSGSARHMLFIRGVRTSRNGPLRTHVDAIKTR